jgi:hypothetical protein
MSTIKECKTCLESKTISEFPINRNTCKKCTSVSNTLKRKKAKNAKNCTICNEYKIETDYNFGKDMCKKCDTEKKCTMCSITKDKSEFKGSRPECKKCKKKRDDELYALSLEENKDARKKCTKCNIYKLFSNFDHARHVCKSCKSEENQMNAEKRDNGVIVKTCKQCLIEKDKSEFEAGRLECKVCRNSKRCVASSSNKDENKDPRLEEKPEFCRICKKPNTEVDFTWRIDTLHGSWKTECKKCFNAKGYDVVYRKKKIEEDHEGFRDHNAKTQREYIKKNPDIVKTNTEKLRTIVDRKIKYIQTYCKQYGKYFEYNEEELMKNKITEPCHYCNFEHEILNGLDKVDCNGDYTDSNTVASGACCNKMKGTYKIDKFLQKVRDIVEFNKLCDLSEVELDKKNRERIITFCGNAEFKNKSKLKIDHLSKSERLELNSNDCYLCGKVGGGVDRVDSNGDYTIENSKPCCSVCNYMKCSLDIADFKKHVLYVYNHTKYWTIRRNSENVGTINVVEKKVEKEKNIRQAVAFVDEDGGIIGVFNGVTHAALAFDVSAPSIFKAVKNSTMVNKYKWINIDKDVYNRYDTEDNKKTISETVAKIVKRKAQNPIMVSDVNDNIIAVFSSIADAVRRIDITNSTISLAIKNGKTCCTFKWKCIELDEYKKRKMSELELGVAAEMIKSNKRIRQQSK